MWIVQRYLITCVRIRNISTILNAFPKVAKQHMFCFFNGRNTVETDLKSLPESIVTFSLILSRLYTRSRCYANKFLLLCCLASQLWNIFPTRLYQNKPYLGLPHYIHMFSFYPTTTKLKRRLMILTV